MRPALAEMERDHEACTGTTETDTMLFLGWLQELDSWHENMSDVEIAQLANTPG